MEPIDKDASSVILEFGLASDLFWDPLGDEELKAVVGHGFSFLEIWGHIPWFDIYSSSMASEVKTMVEDHGLRVRSVHAPCEAEWDISSGDDVIRRKSVDEVVLALQRCREMGGELVVVHPGRAIVSEGGAAGTEHDRRIENSMKSFRQIQQAARDNGTRIAVENQWANEVGGREQQFLRLLDTLDSQVVGICFDSSHANITPGTLEMFRHISHPIITTHLSDNHGTYDEHKPPFTAAIDWHKMLGFLMERGFRGPWLMEVTNGGHDPLAVLAKMESSIERMRTVIATISGGG
jgi:sugar phosphate isomerase/epimerase